MIKTLIIGDVDVVVHWPQLFLHVLYHKMTQQIGELINLFVYTSRTHTEPHEKKKTTTITNERKISNHNTFQMKEENKNSSERPMYTHFGNVKIRIIHFPCHLRRSIHTTLSRQQYKSIKKKTIYLGISCAR